MRRKKHKHTRKTVRFYRINYGFRPPYKVLIDGNFEHALQSMKRGDAKELVAKLLGDQVRVFTTKCVMHELRSLGKDYAETRHACKRYALHRCGHDEQHVSAAQCLLAQLGDKNADHFLVATQDRALQRSVMRVPGGACVFASVNGVHLETPSAMQQKQVKQKEEANLAVKPQERQVLAAETGSAGQQAQQQQGARPLPGFHRKRAKGPNPLAARPKQAKPKVQQGTAQQGAGGAGEGPRAAQPQQEKRKRVRQRRKRGQQSGAAEGDGE